MSEQPQSTEVEVGPTYNVPLLDSLPLNLGATTGMYQALPSRQDLQDAIAVGAAGRLTSGYEVLLNYYYEQQKEIEGLELMLKAAIDTR